MAKELIVKYVLNPRPDFKMKFDIKPRPEIKTSFTIQPRERDHSTLYNRDKADQHPISAITNLQEELDSKASTDDLATVAFTGDYNDLINKPTIDNDKNYIHEQDIAMSVWEINHNLDKFPSVTVVDNNNFTIEGQVEYIDKNNLKISFNATFRGKAYLN